MRTSLQISLAVMDRELVLLATVGPFRQSIDVCMYCVFVLGFVVAFCHSNFLWHHSAQYM